MGLADEIVVQRTKELGVQRLNVLVCGMPKVGKTLWSAQWPSPLFLSAEAGMLSLRNMDVSFVEIDETSKLNKVIMMLSQDGPVREKLLGFNPETVVLDTADEIQRLFVKERNLEKHQETLTQSDWGWLGDQMASLTRALRNLDLNFVCTCHLKEVKDDVSGHVSYKPALQGAFGDQIAQYFDEVLLLRTVNRAEAKDGQIIKKVGRILQSYPDTQYEWIGDRAGTLPPELVVNFTDDYKRFATHIFGDKLKREHLAEVVVQNVSPVLEQPTEQTPVHIDPFTGEIVQEPPPIPETVPTEPEPTPEPETEVQPELTPAPEPEPESADGCVSCGNALTDVGPDLENINKILGKSYCPKCVLICEECNGEIETIARAELSTIRYRARYCKKCFDAMKGRRGRYKESKESNA